MTDLREPHDPTDEHGTGPRDAAADDGRVLLVRRRRAPALGFWVLLALAVSLLGGMVLAWIVDVRTLAGMLYFGVTAAVGAGLPLALVAALVDGAVDRRRRRADGSARRR